MQALAWSVDGSLIYALHVDMTVRVWDVRSQNILSEISVLKTRGTGYLEPLPGNKFLISFINGKSQEISIYEPSGTLVLTKQFEQKTMPLLVRYHFSGVVVASASRETKVYILNGSTLETISSYNHPNPVLSFVLDLSKPNPDGNILVTATLINSNQGFDRVDFTVPPQSVPINFPPFPVSGSTLTAENWLSGQNYNLSTIELIPTAKSQTVEEEVTFKGPITRFRFLGAETDPPSEFFINLNVGNTSNPEFNEICTNGKQFAFIGQGTPNKIYVIPLAKPFKVSNTYPYIQDAHVSLTSYLTFSPHDPTNLLSSGEDGKIRLWKVPEVLTENLTTSLLTLSLKRRVGVVKFSESTQNLIAAASGLPELGLFDLNREINFRSFNDRISGTVQDIEFSSYSDQLFTVFNDGTIKYFDPRTNEGEVLSAMSHIGGGRSRRLLYLHDFSYLASFGGSKAGERQCSIWDVRKFDTPLKSTEFDHNSGAMLPMYQEGSGVIYLGGKGDTSVKYLEICSDHRVIASSGSFESPEQERGLCLMPGSCLNVMSVEVSRMLKLGTDAMRAVRWRLPRTRKEYFQDDVFIPYRDISHPLTQIVDWEAGQTDQFPKIDLQPEDKKKLSDAPALAAKAKYSFEEEINKPADVAFSIENVIENAPELSSSSSEHKSDDDEDSW